MLDKRLPIVAAGLAMIALSGCQNVRDAAGITKKAPDEFAVLRRAPLAVPPSFELRPPRPGERPLPQIDPQQQARSVVLRNRNPGVAGSGQLSTSEQALLARTNPGAVDPDIRQKVDRESALLAVDQRNFVEQLMFWREQPPPGVLVDPKGERRRLQENDALGRTLTEGETPTLERKETIRNRIF